jgi:hypothetical protein
MRGRDFNNLKVFQAMMDRLASLRLRAVGNRDPPDRREALD